MEAIGAARIGGDHVFAVLTGQGRVEQREIESLPGRNIAADGFESQLVAVNLQSKADIERFGAVKLAQVLIDLFPLFVIVLGHQIDPILAGDDGGGDAADHGGSGEGDDEPGPELAIPRFG